jgi:membrane protease YdiL (CAAX protease family)
LFFFLFILWRINPEREPVFIEKNPPLIDVKIGLLGWVIGSSLAFFLGQISDLFLYLTFGELQYEQAAVHQLKIALANPPILIATLFSVLVFAPIVEEFLFRFALQSYLKKYLNPKYAILIAAFAFALLHLSPSQGVGNITLMISLWTLGIFLGWVYERQGSLLASVTLHATFNIISTLQIVFFN